MTQSISFLAMLLVAVFGASGSLAKDGEPKALFRAQDTIQITLDAEFALLARIAKRKTRPFPATLTYGDEVHQVTVEARGKARRKRFCDFPPLRIRFSQKKGEKPRKGSLFRGQKSLKIVTHCRRSPGHQKFIFRELAAYRLFEVMSELHLKTRPAQINYTFKGKSVADRIGFFIEDADDAARRLGLKEVDLPKIRRSQLSASDAARVALFQYMIGNTDYSTIRSPAGSDCCHNVKLLGLGKKSTEQLVPVAYDFDSSGLVDAPYAKPSKKSKLRSVRARLYRGFCEHSSVTRALVPEVLGKRQAFIAAVQSVQGMDERSKSKAVSYLEGFFETLSDSSKMDTLLFKKCK